MKKSHQPSNLTIGVKEQKPGTQMQNKTEQTDRTQIPAECSLRGGDDIMTSGPIRIQLTSAIFPARSIRLFPIAFKMLDGPIGADIHLLE